MNTSEFPAFARYVGIDYSGAATPTTPLKALRAYVATAGGCVEVLPEAGPRKYLCRRGVAEWLARLLAEDTPTLVGIDHGFSFPSRYFEVHRLPPDWPTLLDDFERHWPTGNDHVYVDFVRHGIVGDGAQRTGSSRWRRLCEERCGAKSVFHFDVPGSVAKSTHAGLPWVRFLRQQLGDRLHCWPFDGWTVPVGRSVIAEAYPKLCSGAYPMADRTRDQHDAYSLAMWLRTSDGDGSLAKAFSPDLNGALRTLGRVEGWILGVE